MSAQKKSADGQTVARPRAVDVPLEYRECRTIQHAWRYTTVEVDGGDYVQGLGCTRCGTERFVRIDSRTGELHGSRYHYGRGYLLRGGGLDPGERAILRLQAVEAQFSGQKVAKPKRKRSPRAVVEEKSA